MQENIKVQEYIRENMPKTYRQNKEDDDTLFGLPYPYTVPCAEKHFNELYYWDTYFTNQALFVLGDIAQAKNNVCNILHLIERFGYMPNGSRTYYLKRSQPPYAALMADEVYRKTQDKAFLRYAFGVLKREYSFWMTNRVSPNGLNHYGCENDDEECREFYRVCVIPRLGELEGRSPVEAGRHYYAEAESGWDFNPRFGGFCMDYNPVDLNSNLYFYEKAFAEYEQLLGEGDGSSWAQRANERKEKMNAMLWNEKEGVYQDYNAVTGKRSEIVSAAAFQPYFTGVAGEEQTGKLTNLLRLLESDWGVYTTSGTDRLYQWAFPNVWAPCQFVAVNALLRSGMEAEGKRIAGKYMKLIETNFARYGKLFEKYNGKTGGIDAASEYGTPEMLGWTAGAYMAFTRLS